jgi:hypothetical protein
VKKLEEFLAPFTIDFDKLLKRIPRPERSGCISVLCSFMLVIAFTVQIGGGNGGDTYSLRQLLKSIVCLIAPWTCPVQANEEQEEVKEHKFILLYPGIGKEGCSCHYEMKIYGLPLRIYDKEPWPQVSCDSDDMIDLYYDLYEGPIKSAPPRYFSHITVDGESVYGMLEENHTGELKPGEAMVYWKCENPKEVRKK